MNFAVSSEHQVRLKESEKRDKYLDLAGEMEKKLWNMKVTVISIVISAQKELEIRERVETIQMTALLRLGRIPRRVLETWRDWLSLKLLLTLVWKTLRRVKWITTTRKSSEHVRATYGNTRQLFRP